MYDILGNLPIEICERILLFLCGEDLLNCSIVSKKWRFICSTDFLWRRVVKLEFPEELKYTTGCDKEFLRCYRRGSGVVRNWSGGRFWTLENSGGDLGRGYLSNGGVIATVGKDSGLTLTDVNSGKAEVLDRLPPVFVTEPGTDRRSVGVRISPGIFSLERRRRDGRRETYLYDYKDLRLTFRRKMTFGKDSDGNPILSEDSSPDISFKGTIGKSFILQDSKTKQDFFWDPSKDEVTGKVKKFSGCRDFVYRKTYFLCSTEVVRGFDLTGEERIRIDLSAEEDFLSPLPYIDDVCLHFNREVILVEMMATGELTTACGWTWTDTKRYPKIVVSRNEICLHPKIPAVLQVVEENDVFEIRTHCLLKGTVLTVIDFRLKHGLDHTFYGGGHLSVVHYRFVLYIPGYNTDFYKEHILLDLLTRKTVLHESSKDFRIEYVGSKLIQGKRSVKGVYRYQLRIFT